MKIGRKAILFLIVPPLAVALAWIAYLSVGKILLGAVYGGHLFPFLSSLMSGRSTYPLEYYSTIAGRWMVDFTWCAVFYEVFAAFLAIVSTMPAWPMAGKWVEDHTALIEKSEGKSLFFWIALASGLGLFAELMIIRTHSSYFQLFAYFKNVSLLSCFLGLGIGFSRGPSSHPPAMPLVIPGLTVLILLMHVLRFSGLSDLLQNPIAEYRTMGLVQFSGLRNLLIAYAFIMTIFILNALCFIPLGHVTARLMTRPQRLAAYGWNLWGSLGGILIFTLLSFLWTPPLAWIAVAGALAVPFYFKNIHALILTLAAIALAAIVLSTDVRVNRFDMYSPYQILTLELQPDSLPVLKASNSYYQRILNLQKKDDVSRKRLEYYSLPYQFKQAPAQVLIVGSGTGNDVSAALINGAKSIDAVEIDPLILRCGQLLHPLQPYGSKKVQVIVDDARAYIRNAAAQYDLIVYGLLDAHTLLSGHSGGIRLDSYVYTVEGFREARKRLAPGGVLCMTFSILSPEMGRKLFMMLQKAFDGQKPLVYQSGYDCGCTFLAGPGLTKPLQASLEFVKPSTEFEDENITTDVSTDDWPFLYMPRRTYPLSSVFLTLILLAISAVMVSRFKPPSEKGFSSVCFLLGAGFMLLETKGITELALVYGSTWVVNSAIIAAVLIMACLANAVVLRMRSINPAGSYVLLILSLGAGLAATYLSFSNLPPALIKIIMPVILVFPLFFSGFVFSAEIRRSTSISSALSSNLLGAMLGGLLEYNSLYFGFRSLYVFAMIIYALAFIFSLAKRQAT